MGVGKRFFSRRKTRRFRNLCRVRRLKRIGVDIACLIVPAVKRHEKASPNASPQDIAEWSAP